MPRDLILDCDRLFFWFALSDYIDWTTFRQRPDVKTALASAHYPIAPDPFAFPVPLVVHCMTTDVLFDPVTFPTLLRIRPGYHEEPNPICPLTRHLSTIEFKY